ETARRLARALARTLAPLVPTATTAVALGLLVGLLLVGLTADDRGTATAGATGTLPGAGTTVAFDIELGDTYVSPSSIEVPAGAEVELTLTNVGAMDHSLALDGRDETMVDPGASTTVRWGPITRATQA